MEIAEGFALKIETNLDYNNAIEIVTEKLKEKGFGILTEIDVKETLKKKINVDFKPYHILGACNPPIANRALKENSLIGVFLPCNVVVCDEGDYRTIAAMNPTIIENYLDNPLIKSIADEVFEILSSVLIQIEQHQ